MKQMNGQMVGYCHNLECDVHHVKIWVQGCKDDQWGAGPMTCPICHQPMSLERFEARDGKENQI